MVDVFISYKRRLRPRVKLLAECLRELKLDVWYDEGLVSGTGYTQLINTYLRSARAIIVCWTPDAFQSNWVVGEATKALDRNVLVSVKLENCELDAPFNVIHAEDMFDWSGERSSAFLKLLERIGSLCNRPGLAEFPGFSASHEQLLAWTNRFPADPLAAEFIVAKINRRPSKKKSEQLFNLSAESLSNSAEAATVAVQQQNRTDTTPADDTLAQPADIRTMSWRKRAFFWSATIGLTSFGIWALLPLQPGSSPALAPTVSLKEQAIVSTDSPASSPAVPLQMQDGSGSVQVENPKPADEAHKQASIVDTQAAANAKRQAEIDSQIATATGDRYANGDGVPQDYIKAHDWYEKAVAVGNAVAMVKLGLLYLNGDGVKQDYTKAREWLEKAAEQGRDDAMWMLGTLYMGGQGVPQDYTLARAWYERSAALGNPVGMFNVGSIYFNGRGVPKNVELARTWYEKAASGGNTEAMLALGGLYAKGQGVAKDNRRALELFESAGAGGNVAGMIAAGALYLTGEGITKDWAKAKDWLQKGSELGNSEAMTMLASLYENGLGVQQDFSQAQVWYEKSAALGNTLAMYKLGVFQLNGWGAARDLAKARDWFERGAKAGNSEAMFMLGSIYEEGGSGVRRDFRRAADWYRKALNAGLAKAEEALKRVTRSQPAPRAAQQRSGAARGVECAFGLSPEPNGKCPNSPAGGRVLD